MSNSRAPMFIYPSAGEAEAVMHPSADTDVVDIKYRRDDGDLVTLDQVRKALADRDAAWERAVEWWWNKGPAVNGNSRDFLAAIREQLETEGN